MLGHPNGTRHKPANREIGILLWFDLWARRAARCALFAVCAGWIGCGNAPLLEQPGPLFTVPLELNGEPIGSAIIDTGGGFEVLLREPFGLTVVGETEVLAFGGLALVEVTEGFDYSAGGIGSQAAFAIVGLPACDCNGVGFRFFRKTGVVLELDFTIPAAVFHISAPFNGVTVSFEPPPPNLPAFDGAFFEIDVASGGSSQRVLGILDTGAVRTAMRRGLVGAATPLAPDRQSVTITHDQLGTIVANVVLFDTVGLPDVILGTDAMQAWGPHWTFSFVPGGGTVTVRSSGEVGESGVPPSIPSPSRAVAGG